MEAESLVDIAQLLEIMQSNEDYNRRIFEPARHRILAADSVPVPVVVLPASALLSAAALGHTPLRGQRSPVKVTRDFNFYLTSIATNASVLFYMTSQL